MADPKKIQPPGRPFKKGQSGNPGGRPKMLRSVVELAREATDEAMATLIQIATDKKASPSARVAAAQAILDRGWGKPTQTIDATLRDAGVRQFELSDDQLAEIIASKAEASHPH